MESENWPLPVMLTLAVDLRRLACRCAGRRLWQEAARASGESGRLHHGPVPRVRQRFPGHNGQIQEVGMMGLCNQLFKIYFRINKLNLCKPMAATAARKYSLLQFSGIATAVRKLERNEQFFISCGIYLILEKLRMITYRNLFKKVFLILGSFQLDIAAFTAALQFLQEEDADGGADPSASWPISSMKARFAATLPTSSRSWFSGSASLYPGGVAMPEPDNNDCTKAYLKVEQGQGRLRKKSSRVFCRRIHVAWVILPFLFLLALQAAVFYWLYRLDSKVKRCPPRPWFDYVHAPIGPLRCHDDAFKQSGGAKGSDNCKGNDFRVAKNGLGVVIPRDGLYRVYA
uniref:Uncharacterized protein n=1 Tax=Macrostomum lignano TaxID=282301 RepID=A0A1I8JN52_9PLAT